MKVGLYLSRDDGAVSNTVNVDALAREFKDTCVCKVYNSFFRLDAHQDMLKAAKENNLEAVVLAGNSPKYFDRTLAAEHLVSCLERLGINRNRIGFANIKEGAALPHKGAKAAATAKASTLIKTALARVELVPDVATISLTPRRAVLVLGTTLGGLMAADQLLAKDYRVYLVDRQSDLRFDGSTDPRMQPTVTRVIGHHKTIRYHDADLARISGWCGDYRATIKMEKGEKDIQVGGVILAMGDDVTWTKYLKPLLQLDVNDGGELANVYKDLPGGYTADPGVCFVPYRADDTSFEFTTTQASNSVLALTTILDEREIDHTVLVSEVQHELCGGCGTCVKTCAFGAASIDLQGKRSFVDPMKCKGCGNCVVSCPTGARDLLVNPKSYMVKAITTLSKNNWQTDEPKILAMLCDRSGYRAADAAALTVTNPSASAYSPNVMPLWVECAANIDTQYILEAFAVGFDGVAVAICKDECCHFVVGNTDMERRVGLFREILRSRHIDPDRLRILHVSPNDGQLFAEEMKAFAKDLLSVTAHQSAHGGTVTNELVAR